MVNKQGKNTKACEGVSLVRKTIIATSDHAKSELGSNRSIAGHAGLCCCARPVGKSENGKGRNGIWITLFDFIFILVKALRTGHKGQQ